MKILVIMQYWEGDRKKAEEAARLAADLLPEMSELVDLAFLYRYDSNPPSAKTQIHCQNKFGKVYALKCSRIGEGWPGGCNELAYEALGLVPMGRHLHHAYTEVNAVLLMESDMVFTRQNWDMELISEWGKTMLEGKLICGALQEKGEINEHINGGALFAWDASTQITCLRGGPYLQAWDFVHRRQMVENARPSQQFFLDYKKETITADELFAERDGVTPLVYHGVKDDSAVKAIRLKYELK